VEDKEVKQAFDRYAEKVNEFLKRAPFHYVKARQFVAGEEHLKPGCSVCGSKRSYWYMVVTDKDGQLCYIGSTCYYQVESKIIPGKEVR